MPRYVAFLRGVSPMNARMPELKKCFESAGFEDVRILLSSGNVAFSCRASKEPLPAAAKPVVTFLPAALGSVPELPIELDGACIHEMRGLEVLVSYVPNQKGPVFMALLERTFGKNITTRTFDTVRKCAAA